MKNLIIYISIHHENTEKVAKAIAEVLNAELVKVYDVDITAVSKYDLIGFGSGMYSKKPHKDLLSLNTTYVIHERWRVWKEAYWIQ